MPKTGRKGTGETLRGESAAPGGRAGEDIPFIARMIGAADSREAMNTNRVYRKKLPKEDVIREIEKNKGARFDPRIADVMLRLPGEDKRKAEE